MVDVHFDLSEDKEFELPLIHEALYVTRVNGAKITLEVQQHIGENTVRCVAMDSTDGLTEAWRPFRAVLTSVCP